MPHVRCHFVNGNFLLFRSGCLGNERVVSASIQANFIEVFPNEEFPFPTESRLCQVDMKLTSTALPDWSGWRRLRSHLEFAETCGGKKSSAKCWKQL